MSAGRRGAARRCGCAVRCSGETVVEDMVRGHVDVRQQPSSTTSILVRSDGSPTFHLGRRRRHRDAHHPRVARRGPPHQHPATGRNFPRARREAAALRPPAADRRNGSRASVQASRCDRGGRVPRPRLSCRKPSSITSPGSVGRTATRKSSHETSCARVRYRSGESRKAAAASTWRSSAWVNAQHMKMARPTRRSRPRWCP